MTFSRLLFSGSLAYFRRSFYFAISKRPLMLCSVITLKVFLEQVGKDLIGKDSFRGVTLTYAWLANQFGHFGLGFIPSVVLYAIFPTWSQRPPFRGLKPAMAVSSFWILFETYNFLGPLLLQQQKPYVFPPRWGNIAFDTITDVAFFALGAFTAAVAWSRRRKARLILACIGLALLYPSYWWYTCKMYLQYAEYPSQIRLGEWNLKINAHDATQVSSFLNIPDSGNHMLLFGGRSSGKTSLAIAIATERSFRREACFYTSAMKLLSLFFDHSPYSGPWNWRSANLLVIDDLNPGEPLHNELITAAAFRDIATASGQDNLRLLASKNIIWVAGSEGSDAAFRKKWVDMLQEIGIERRKISVVNLGDDDPQRRVRQAAQ